MNKKGRYALLSVSNRYGLDSFARALIELGFALVASEGTAKYLRENSIEVIDVVDITEQPPIMSPQGIKLIHPKIFGGILADPDNGEHMADLEKYDIPRFEIVACNFYPFSSLLGQLRLYTGDQAEDEYIHKTFLQNIDIGGPAMARCAAKNYKHCLVIVDPYDYWRFLIRLRKSLHIEADDPLRLELALKAFQVSLAHDQAIISYLTSVQQREVKKHDGK